MKRDNNFIIHDVDKGERKMWEGPLFRELELLDMDFLKYDLEINGKRSIWDFTVEELVRYIANMSVPNSN